MGMQILNVCLGHSPDKQVNYWDASGFFRGWIREK